MLELFKENDTSYRFVLKSASGGIILNSVVFKSEDAVNHTASKLPDLVKKPSAFERCTNHNGKFQFNLKDINGKLIGQSLLYDSEAGMENGIKNLVRSVASVEGLY